MSKFIFKVIEYGYDTNKTMEVNGTTLMKAVRKLVISDPNFVPLGSGIALSNDEKMTDLILEKVQIE